MYQMIRAAALSIKPTGSSWKLILGAPVLWTSCPPIKEGWQRSGMHVMQVRKEGRTFTHPWQSIRLNGWNSVRSSSAWHSIKASNDVPADHGLVMQV